MEEVRPVASLRLTYRYLGPSTTPLAAHSPACFQEPITGVPSSCLGPPKQCLLITVPELVALIRPQLGSTQVFHRWKRDLER